VLEGKTGGGRYLVLSVSVLSFFTVWFLYWRAKTVFFLDLERRFVGSVHSSFSNATDESFRTRLSFHLRNGVSGPSSPRRPRSPGGLSEPLLGHGHDRSSGAAEDGNEKTQLPQLPQLYGAAQGADPMLLSDGIRRAARRRTDEDIDEKNRVSWVGDATAAALL